MSSNKRDEKAGCTNCNGQHPASYKDCPAYSKINQTQQSNGHHTRCSTNSDGAKANAVPQTQEMYNKMCEMFKQLGEMMAKITSILTQ